ncbi:hypothetical protein KIPB_016269 [Kipferlia bialata]|uniref:Uncharacterized protein n=1 Tax=Kipferlia bialata TaxID=797122 RepID=A0A9K3DB07_9EUKA|nr:hypothetical protein KIPB_016269 [Kipferlia bialata]|eukprot:g16269.t1
MSSGETLPPGVRDALSSLDEGVTYLDGPLALKLKLLPVPSLTCTSSIVPDAQAVKVQGDRGGMKERRAAMKEMAKTHPEVGGMAA